MDHHGDLHELSFGDKYHDAFWRLAPIALAVVGAVVMTVLRPSALAAVAACLLVLAGALGEVVVWRRLQARWRRGLHPESVGQMFEGVSRPVWIAVSVVMVLVAWTWKAQGIQGGSWWAAALFVLAMLPLILVMGLVVHVLERAWRRFLESFGGEQP